MSKIPLMKKVRYKKKTYIIADYFKGKYKLIRAGEPIRWVSPKTIGMKTPSRNIGMCEICSNIRPLIGGVCKQCRRYQLKKFKRKSK